MNNLSKIPDAELLSMAKTKAETERQLTLEVIDLLWEIQSRKLHLKRGFSSLHEYCVKELKYSDGAAFRRIKAMRLVEELPKVKESIQSGALTLSTASQLQRTFEAKAKEQKPMSMAEKVELVSLVQNQSRRQVERTLAKVCPAIVQTPERISSVNESQFKVELIIEGELFNKIEKLKNLTSHKNRNLIELLEDLVDQELKRRDPQQKPKPPRASPAKTNLKPNASQTRYLSSIVKFHVWRRDKGRCTYLDSLTQRMCESSHKLTYEHIQPYSMGGNNNVENLRLLCANHNQLTATNIFGKRN